MKATMKATKKKKPPDGGVMFALNMVKILVFTVFCDQKKLMHDLL
jgi:hypothetical protein